MKVFLEQIKFYTQSIKTAWQEELGIQIDDVVWEESLSRIQSCSVNVRHHLIHYSKTNLHGIYPTISPLCDQCLLSAP